MLSLQTRANDSPNDLCTSPKSPYLPSSPIPAFDCSPRPDSMLSCTLDDILLPGDIVAEGGYLQGEPIRRVSLGSSPRASFEGSPEPQPATEFQVIRRLGTGSYAVVYLVREILSRSLSSSSSEESAVLGSLELDGTPCSSETSASSIVYGREYAIKCLSKANLDNDQLSAQMIEVKIHQSLHPHPNIVTLHRTLETPSFLLLLLEFVPGEDLFYFLEQARDHLESHSDDSFSSIASNTPPTPSLLATLIPSQLLSRTRLRLIASMFGQMCEAVAACHNQHVFHRDIKPENFIVTDGCVSRSDGGKERKVFVKLTDFGLSTVEQYSTDMDCGSAPYMSYECRNNVAPSYRTDAADVWSLGIVLINMLYHLNPWTDTAQGACSSFTLYRSNPTEFFLNRFSGMTTTVAEFLVTKVFCILEDGKGPTGAVRVSAHEFGQWAHNLPDLLAPHIEPVPFVKRHQRVTSTASSIDHPVSSTSQVSHRPCSRNPSGNTPISRTPAIRSRSLSRAPSIVGMSYDRPEVSELSTINQDIEESQEHLPLPEEPASQQYVEVPQPVAQEESPSPSRSASNRRRKRGRKGKGASISAPPTPKDETLDMLAKASQSLAREISKQSMASKTSIVSGASSGRSRRSGPVEPPSLFPVPIALLSNNPMAPPPLPALAISNLESTPAPARSPAPPTKKPSKWKLSIGKSKGSAVAPSPTLPAEEPSPVSPITPPSPFGSRPLEPPAMGATATQVTSLLMGLNAPSPANAAVSSSKEDAWRGRRQNRGSPAPSASRSAAGSQSRSRPRTNGSSAFGASEVPVPPLPHGVFSSPNHSSENWAGFDRERERGRSPYGSKSTKTHSVSSSSSNWRNSTSTTSSAFTSTSAFTSYSNASSRSVSTAATSVSASSWRNKDNASINSSNSSRYHQQYPGVPRNIKIMNGIPSELVKVPRGQHSPFDRDGGTVRKQRSRKPMDLPLGTISERPNQCLLDSRSSGSKSPISGRTEDGTAGSPNETIGSGKAQKGQINTLEKILSALRR